MFCSTLSSWSDQKTANKREERKDQSNSQDQCICDQRTKPLAAEKGPDAYRRIKDPNAANYPAVHIPDHYDYQIEQKKQRQQNTKNPCDSPAAYDKVVIRQYKQKSAQREVGPPFI